MCHLEAKEKKVYLKPNTRLEWFTLFVNYIRKIWIFTANQNLKDNTIVLNLFFLLQSIWLF